MIRAVMLDFDGVVLESAQLKTNIFRALFQEICPDRVEEIVAYHLANAGISRYVKFQTIYAELLGWPLSEADSQALGRRFSALVEAELHRASLVPGAREFLAQARPRYHVFVVSGMPQEELHAIAKARHLFEWGDEWHGSPRTKPEIIEDILERQHLPPEAAVLVGDARSDWQAAQATGIAFIGRTAQSSVVFAPSVEQILDLWQLPEALNRLDARQMTRGGVR